MKNEDLIGVWVFSIYKDDCMEYTTMKSLLKNESGFVFKKNGRLIIRQNSSWCGTPPIEYKNYNGTWKYTSDSSILINYKYWGGKAAMELKIIDLNPNILKLKVISRKN
jgi:hypothetical protein